MDLRHLPVGTHSLAPKPGSLVRLAFLSDRPRPPPRARNPKLRIEDEDENDHEEDWEVGPRGRICTCNPPGLSGTPLLLGYTRMARRAEASSEGWCPRSDLHRHCARFKCAVSALDYVGQIGAA